MSIQLLKRNTAVFMIFVCVLSYVDAHSQSKPAKTDCSCTTTILDPKDAVEYRKNYKDLFVRRKNKRHTEWIFFPRNYFLFINGFFKSHPDYLGVWFFLGSFNRKVDENQQAHKKQIMFHLVAADKDTQPDFTAFPRHDTTVDYLHDPSKTRIVISPKGNFSDISKSTIGPEHVILVPEDSSRYLRDNYKRRYTFLSKRHSTAMFLCNQTFYDLADFLQKNPDLDGVRISFASYKKIVKCTYQAKKKQFTFILTPIKGNDLMDKKYFEFLLDKYKIKPEDFKRRSEDYNHGSLCPNSCN